MFLLRPDLQSFLIDKIGYATRLSYSPYTSDEATYFHLSKSPGTVFEPSIILRKRGSH